MGIAKGSLPSAVTIWWADCNTFFHPPVVARPKPFCDSRCTLWSHRWRCWSRQVPWFAIRMGRMGQINGKIFGKWKTVDKLMDWWSKPFLISRLPNVAILKLYFSNQDLPKTYAFHRKGMCVAQASHVETSAAGELSCAQLPSSPSSQVEKFAEACHYSLPGCCRLGHSVDRTMGQLSFQNILIYRVWKQLSHTAHTALIKGKTFILLNRPEEDKGKGKM